MKYTLGIDIGGTKCAVVLGKDKMTPNVTDVIVDKVKFETPKNSLQAALDDIVFACEDLLAKHGIPFEDVKGIGVSCGGPLNSKTGRILSPPNLPGWDDVAITDLLTEHFGAPAVLINDANACALAEWKYGAGKGTQNMIFLTFGTGIGAGLILNGRLYTGASDLAGEVGHVRMSQDGPEGYGKVGSFEGYCSGGGIVNLAGHLMERTRMRTALSSMEPLTARNIAEAARAGDTLAADVYAISARRLGQGLAMLIDILNPEVIVIGSIYARDTELFQPAVDEMIRAEALPGAAQVCRVVPCGLGEQLGDIAALAAVLD